MKKKKIMVVSLLAMLISSCTLDLGLSNLAANNSSVNKVETTSSYCENFEACKVQVDSSIHVENFDIYNSYTEAYNKVKEVSVVINGFNYKSNNVEEYVLSAYYSGFIIEKESINASSYRYSVLTTGLDLVDLPYYEVLLSDGTRIEANLKGMFNDAYYHIGVFAFETSKNITLANIVYDKDLLVGTEILTLSSPSVSTSLQNTMTKGIISGVNRQVEVATDIYAMGFQFDAPTNEGSQGGAVFDENGNIFGMVAGKVMSSSTVYIESISFGNNLKDIKHIIDKLLLGETYEKPLIGVSVIDLATVLLLSENYYLYPLDAGVYNIDEVTKEQEKLKISIPSDLYQGLYVSEIASGSVAANAGITAGDVITRVDNVVINDNTALAMYLYTLDKGATITIYTYLNPNGYIVRL